MTHFPPRHRIPRYLDMAEPEVTGVLFLAVVIFVGFERQVFILAEKLAAYVGFIFRVRPGQKTIWCLCINKDS